MSSTAIGAGSTGRRVSASGLILLAENIVRLGVSAGISFWLARQLGPAQFGVLNFATALLAIFGIGAAMGLEVPAVLRLTQAKPSTQERILSSLLGLRFLASVVCLGVACAIALVARAGDVQEQTVAVIVSLSLVAQVPTVFDYGFKSRVQAREPALARIASTLVSTLAKWWVVQQGLGLTALAWTVVAEAAVGSGLLWWAWRRQTMPGDKRRFDLSTALSFAGISLPFAATNIAVMVYMKADVVMLGALSTNEQTGLYTLVQKISEVLYVVPVVLIDSAYPVLARRQGEASGQLLFDIAVASALAAAAIGACAGGPLVHLIFGERYAASAALIPLHAWTCVFLALDVARHRWLAAQGLQRFAFRLAALGAAVGLGLNFLLIPGHGARGATLSALLAFLATSLIGTLLFAPLRETARMQWRALWPFGRLLAMGWGARVPEAAR
jgi:PST family polysaccharide transporter